MGLMCSWIALKDVSKPDLLNAIGLVEADAPDEVFPGCRRVNFCFREMPNGWLVVASEDFDWASNERILELSRLGLTVGCQMEDKVEMESIATAAEGGRKLWRVYHNSNPEKPRLQVEGSPPVEFAAIRDRFCRQQDEAGGDEADVDYIHEIPLEMAKAACGYRLDEEDAPFRALKPIGCGDEEAGYGGRPWEKPNARLERSRPDPPVSPPTLSLPPRLAHLESLGLANAHAAGFRRSWLAVKGVPLEALLHATRLKPLTPTERYGPRDSVSHAYAEMPGGWIVIGAQKLRWASRSRLLELSRLGLTVAVQFSEQGYLGSTALGAENGAELWGVYHSNDPKRSKLEVEGTPPPAFVEIRDRLFQQQAEAGGDQSDTDHIHEVPMRLAQAVCGFYWFDDYDRFIALKRRNELYNFLRHAVCIYD